MHPLTKKLIEFPEDLQAIENAILTRERLEKYGTSASSRKSIEEEKKAVEEFKKLTS
jgi:hypothetical protein